MVDELLDKIKATIRQTGEWTRKQITCQPVNSKLVNKIRQITCQPVNLEPVN